MDFQAGKQGIDIRNLPHCVCTRAQDTPGQGRLASFAIDSRVEVAFAKRHEASFGVVRVTRSACAIEQFLQDFEQRAGSEVAGTQHLPPT